jgi:vancomycin permeability regulator SanA
MSVKSPDVAARKSTPASRVRLRWLGRRTCLACFAWFTVHTVAICIDGLRDDRGPADVAVVLGNMVHPDGRPSLPLKARLDTGISLYRDGTVKRLIMSGGRGREGFEEADVMADYAIAHGVPERAVVVDRGGIDTWHTARFTAAYMQRENLQSVIAVSQYFHIARCKLALRRFGLRQIGGVHARFFDVRDLYSIVREFAGWYAYRLRRDF